MVCVIATTWRRKMFGGEGSMFIISSYGVSFNLWARR
jgi:hypothetical protein